VKLLKACFAATAFLVAFTAEAAPTWRAPNFVVVLLDNVGQDWFGCCGSDEGKTPAMDKLATTGLRFGHCYVTPLCSTTRAALLTGRHAYRTGWRIHSDTAIYGGGYLDWKREVTFARALKSTGYATAITGKWQINDFYKQPEALQKHGFDEHFVWTGALVGEGNADQRYEHSQKTNTREMESRYWDPVVFHNGVRKEIKGRFGPDVYLEHLVDFMQRNRKRPFLAYYATPLVHVPVVPVPNGPAKDAPPREQFAAMVRYADRQIGELIAALERLRLRDDTIVIVTTDNGTPKAYSGRVGGKPAQGALGTLKENGINVPLIVNCPARVPGGRVSNRLLSCVDVFPTLLDLAGVADHPRMQGRSLIPALRGSREAWRSEFFYEHNFAHAWIPKTEGVRDSRWKYTKYVSDKPPEEELYDLQADPLEERNLAGEAAGTAELRRLRGRHAAWLKAMEEWDGTRPWVDPA